MMDRKTFQETLPKKRISSGILFFDARGHLLIVNPTYKATWEIPGGVVEKGESPREAVIREVMEELRLICRPQRLLCVDWSAETETRTESLQFIFLAPLLTESMIAAISLPKEELSDYALLPPQQAVERLNKKLRRRVLHCLTILESQETLYLEEQQPLVR